MNPFIDWGKVDGDIDNLRCDELFYYVGYDWKDLGRGEEKVVEYIQRYKDVDEVVLDITKVKELLGLRLNTSCYRVLREVTRLGFIELKRHRTYYVNPSLVRCSRAQILNKYGRILKRDYPEVYLRLTEWERAARRDKR